MQEELRLAEEKKEEEKNAEEHDQDKSHDEEETKDGIRITTKIGVEEIKPTGKKAVTFDTSEIQTVDSKAFEETKKKRVRLLARSIACNLDNNSVAVYRNSTLKELRAIAPDEAARSELDVTLFMGTLFGLKIGRAHV